MTQLSDEQLDDLLRRSFNAAVPDDGFSSQVMRALPARSHGPEWLLPVAVLLGVLLAWLALSPSPLWQQAAREWLSANLHASSMLVCALMLGSGLLSCVWAMEETS